MRNFKEIKNADITGAKFSCQFGAGNKFENTTMPYAEFIFNFPDDITTKLDFRNAKDLDGVQIIPGKDMNREDLTALVDKIKLPDRCTFSNSIQEITDYLQYTSDPKLNKLLKSIVNKSTPMEISVIVPITKKGY